MSTELVPYSNEFRGFTDIQGEMLEGRLNESHIKQRAGGGGRKLSYIKGDYAIATANRIFGFGKWGYKVISRSHEICKDEKKGEIEYYTADIELMVVGSMFPFPGDGVGIVTSPYTVEMHEKARKESVTDALKRALRHYGDQFGLSLYDEDNYIETENGTVKQVKDVGKATNGYSRPATKVVDAMPAHEPTVENLQQLINRCRYRATKLNYKTIADYERYCASVIGKPAPETLADVNALNADMAAREKKAS